MKRTAFILLISLLVATMAGAGEPASLVVVVNPQSGVDSLSRDEVIDIFLGRYRKLPSGKTALPIDIAESNTERARFYQLLVKKSSAEMSSYWARLVFSGQTSPPFQVPDTKSALELVQSSPNAIAYIDRSAVSASVKVVFELKP
ncbi:MAG: phosphate ABC transporter substrate-binding protein [Steroidobacteraceae bacterium]|nr:phosphate ABC transporter substrate-binding protein [Steroidobacteraceae bacterium]